MGSAEQQKKILIGVAVLFVIAVVYRIMNPFEQERVEELVYTGRPAEQKPRQTAPGAGGGKSERESPFRLMLGLLRNPPKHSGSTVSPFFLQPVPGLASAQTESGVAPVATAETTELDFESDALEEKSKTAAAAEAADRVADAYAALNEYSIIGVYSSGGERAVFFQKEKQSIIARAGDLIGGRFRVESISAGEIVFKAEGVPDRLRLSLSPFLKPYEQDALK